MNHSIIVLGFVIVLALCVGSAGATEIWVPDDYLTIQAAVNSASAYDTIIVKDGTYTENVRVNTAHLTIKSENGSDGCVVDASASGNGFEITADYVNISRFTVTGANSKSKAGIRIKNADHCTITQNNITGNYYGVYLSSSSSHNNITHNIIISNTNNGIHITADSTSKNNITHNTITLNRRGIYSSAADENNISCNYIAFNTKCGIRLTSSSVDNTIKHNNIIANGELQDDGSYHWQFYNNQKKDVSATNNWWGTTDDNKIDAAIYDDEEGKGKVIYTPKLEIPSTCAVPEPITLVMVTLGILGVIGAVYRKRER
ncbi:MAG: right-handed parallel beta-helix repeat-containing protein [Candidatus Syntropharchaeales archaeon]